MHTYNPILVVNIEMCLFTFFYSYSYIHIYSYIPLYVKLLYALYIYFRCSSVLPFYISKVINSVCLRWWYSFQVFKIHGHIRTYLFQENWTLIRYKKFCQKINWWLLPHFSFPTRHLLSWRSITLMYFSITTECVSAKQNTVQDITLHAQ